MGSRLTRYKNVVKELFVPINFILFQNSYLGI